MTLGQVAFGSVSHSSVVPSIVPEARFLRSGYHDLLLYQPNFFDKREETSLSNLILERSKGLENPVDQSATVAIIEVKIEGNVPSTLS